jgi:hypothetical protein
LYFFYIIPSKCRTATLESVNHFPCLHSENSEHTLHKVPETDLSREVAEEAGGKPGVAAPPQVEGQKTLNLAPGDDVKS